MFSWRSFGVSTHSRPKAAASKDEIELTSFEVSTHSRPKAAAQKQHEIQQSVQVSTHSRPKAAASYLSIWYNWRRVSTHSRPKAAAQFYHDLLLSLKSFNTQPPEGGCFSSITVLLIISGFQHTAARRRLHFLAVKLDRAVRFQHTAARRRLLELYAHHLNLTPCFNTQPPEGGC